MEFIADNRSIAWPDDPIIAGDETVGDETNDETRFGEVDLARKSPTESPTADLNNRATHPATGYVKIFASADERERDSLRALATSEHIRRMCRQIPHNRILDVGMGDGQVLNRLDHVNFGQRLCGLDITDVHHAEARGKKWKHLEELRTLRRSGHPA